MPQNKIKVNGFIIALLMAIPVAYLIPEGSRILHLNEVTDVGIGLIFFFYGLKLSLGTFRSGVRNYKLHLLIHLSTFILFPLLVLPFKSLMVGESAHLLWVGMFFLAVLPSTVSSSVVMVSIAKGNIPAAIFNASLSGLLGVVLTPLWLGLVINDAQGVSAITVISKLLLQIVIPLGLGIILHHKIGHLAVKNNTLIGYFDKTVIVLIVYSSFCLSFNANLFSGMQLNELLLLYTAILVLFLLVMFLVNMVSKKLGFTTEDRVTALFCGSKKSLVHGSVMAKIMFGHSINASIYILPVMIYHISQLLIIAFIAERFGNREELIKAQTSK
ncbi:bile acid:sodium symporter [Flavobacteriaceae bacterium KMM 6897]|nr:bile acid:sodium symporter [Flavobacteriaceae bacterium KMM 6897]MEB8347185.1 bile acid:sodium symporter [Flavobacteriaceae bacterium KMM 6898]